MPPELQVRLLRVLESATVTRVGGTAPIPIDVRVLAATNYPIAEAVPAGKLREDLLYRLNVFQVALPPLRERGEDVVLIAEHFLAEQNAAEPHVPPVHREGARAPSLLCVARQRARAEERDRAGRHHDGR